MKKLELLNHLTRDHDVRFTPDRDGSPPRVMRDWLEAYHQRKHEFQEIPFDHTQHGEHRGEVPA